MIRQGNAKKELSKLVWSLAVKTLLLVASLIDRGTGAEAQNHFQCIEEGYHADPKDCHIYYRCVDWGIDTSRSQSSLVPFQFECGPGTVFSHAKGNICVHPSDSERLECRKSANDLDSNINYYEDNQEEKYPHPSWPSSFQSPPNDYPSYLPPQNPNKGYPSNTPQQLDHFPSNTLPTDTSQGSSSNPSSTPSNHPSYLPPSHINITAPGNSDCQQEGFMAHPKDCKKFIRCTNDGSGSYQTFEFTCGDGTLWDSTIQACNHDWAARGNCFSESTSNQNSDSSTTQSNQQSTEEKLTTVSTKSPQGPGYLPPSTPRPTTSKPSHTQLPTSSPSTTTQESLTPNPSTPSSSDITATPTTTSPQNDHTSQGVANGDCTMEGFFANPKNCRKFYRCVGQEGQQLIKYEFECGEGTAWDPSIQACNHEYAVPECKPSDSNGFTNTPSTVSVNNDEEKNEMTPETESSITKEPGTSTKEKPTSTTVSMSTTIAEETNPTTESSTSVDSSKATETLTSIETSTSSETMKPSLTTSKPDQSTMMSTDTTTTHATTNKQPELSDCKDEGFYADPNDCHKFYRCVKTNESYTKYSFDCASGTAWDQSILTCNYAHLVSSCNLETNEISGTEKPISSTVKSEDDNNNTSVTSTTTFTSTIMSSSSSDQASTEAVTIQDDASSESSNKSTESMMESSVTSTTTTKILETSSESSSSVESSTTGSMKPSMSSDKIKCDSAGFYPHPTQCDKFYRCIDNGNGFNIYHFNCAPGTIFDPSISTCNYPESVYPPRDCNGNQSSSLPPSHDTTTTTPPMSTSESKITTQVPTTTSSETDEKVTTTEMDVETTTESTGDVTEIGSTTDSSELTSTEGNVGTSTMLTEDMTESTATQATTNTEETGTSVTQPDSTESTEPTDSATQTDSTESTEPTDSATQPDSTEGTKPTDSATQPDSTESTEPTDSATQPDSTEITESTAVTEAESSTESIIPTTTTITTTTTAAETDTSSSMAPCTLGNLTDEQIVLICPTGFRRHPKSCNMFYQCTSDGHMEIKVLVLACPENTIFDEEKLQCLAESESSQPCNTELTSARFYRQIEKSSMKPIKVTRDSLCPGEGHYPYQKGCSDVFFKCRKNQKNSLQGYLYRCPNNFVYWSVSRRCEQISQLRTCSEEQYNNDKEGKDIWKKRWQLPIEDSNLSA